jgi:hypothetical protein
MPAADREGVPESVRADAAQADALTDAAQTTGDDCAAGESLQGLSWSWELDFETLLAALNEPALWNRPAPTAESADSTANADARPDADAGAKSGTATAAKADADPTASPDANANSDADVDPYADADIDELVGAVGLARCRCPQ